MKRKIFVWLFVVCMFFPSIGMISSQEVDSSSPLRILLVSGGHWFDRENLTKMILDRPNTVLTEISVPEDQDRLTPEIKNEYDILIFHDQSSFELTDSQKENLSKMWEEGIPTMMLHHALISHTDFPLFREVYGTAFFLGPKTIDGQEYPGSTYLKPTQVPMKIVDHQHPITKGLEDFVLDDEVFNHLWFADEGNHVLIETVHPESSRPVCWTRIYKKSPVFVLIQGDCGTAFNDPHYREVFYRSLDWLVSEKP